jgi:hypothetical protein
LHYYISHTPDIEDEQENDHEMIKGLKKIMKKVERSSMKNKRIGN